MPVLLLLVVMILVVLVFDEIWRRRSCGLGAPIGLTKRSATWISFVTLTSAMVFGGIVAAPVGATSPRTPSTTTSTHVVAHQATTGTVTGVVTDKGTGVGLNGVCIVAQQGPTYEAVTATVNGVPGSYTLSGITAPSLDGIYFDPTCNGTVSSDYEDAIANSVPITFGETTTQNMSLVKGGVITGTVTNSAGVGIPGVCMSSPPNHEYRSDVGIAIVTGTNGSYSFSGVTPGGTSVAADVTCTGRQTLPYESQSTRSLVTVTAGSTTIVNFVLTPGTGGSLSGTVTDPSGAGVAGVCIYVGQISEGNGYGDAVTAPDGSYTITNLAVGSYNFMVKPDCGRSTLPYVAQDLRTPVRVTAGATTTQNVSLFPGDNSLSGNVTNSSGVGIAGVCVFVGQGEGGTGAAGGSSLVTNASGYYSVTDLAPGSYNVDVDPTCASTVVSYYIGQTVQATITEGVPTTGVNAALTEGGMITGFVTDSSGDPIDGVCVNAEVAGMGVVGWIATDVSGSYTLSSLPAGLNYTVFADPTCLGTGPNFLGYQGAQDTGVSVSVGVTTTAATIVLGLAPSAVPPPTGYQGVFGTPSSASVTSSGATVSLGSNSVSETVTVPAGVLPPGTTLSVYPVTNPTTLDVPSNQNYVIGVAVVWQIPPDSTPSGAPITLTITDPAFTSVDVIFELTSSGPEPVPTGDVTIDPGVSVTINFPSTSDPTFIVTQPALATQAQLSISKRSGRVGTALALATSGGSGTGAVTFTVSNGTASGCAISGSSLTTTSAGTCIVTATKKADSAHTAISSAATTITMSLPARPSAVTLGFAAGKSALNAAAQKALGALAKKLVAGASVTVTGYAKGNVVLAKSRARVTSKYLSGKIKIHATLKTVTSASLNKVTVITTKQ